MKSVRQFLAVFFSTCVAVIVFAAISTALDYFLVEVLMKMSQIPPLVNSVFLILLVLLFSCIFESGKRIRFKVVFFCIIGCLGIMVLLLFHEKKAYALISPKIFSVYPNRGLQAQIVTIRGVRFLPPEKKGKVFINKDEMVVKFWSDEMITVEQPVTSSVGWIDISVVSNSGRVSNKFPFYIPNLKELK